MSLDVIHLGRAMRSPFRAPRKSERLNEGCSAARAEDEAPGTVCAGGLVLFPAALHSGALFACDAGASTPCGVRGCLLPEPCPVVGRIAHTSNTITDIKADITVIVPALIQRNKHK